jgi:hypothetical protein
MSSEPTSRADVEDSEVLEVLSIEMPVLSATSVFVHKLNALDEHHCDLSGVIPVARALREQIDWTAVRRRTDGNVFAATVLFLLARLEVAPDV